MRVFTPQHLDYLETFFFCKNLKKHIREKELIVDFSRTTFVKPFGLLLLAFSLRDFAKKRNANDYKTGVNIDPKRTVISYLAHIGFFRHSGLEYGNLPGEAHGSNTYLPIHHITRRSLLNIGESDMPIEYAIEKEAIRLTSMVLRLEHVPSKHPVAYCFREVVRNTFEHANTNTCTLCVQQWRDRNMEIAIFDRGRGVLEALNEKYDFTDSYDALSEAIKPGVSRVNFEEQEDSPWANSGYGLYVLSELADRTGGSFLISSGNATLRKYNNNVENINYGFDGTCLRLEVKKSPGINIADLIKTIVKEGEAITGDPSKKASKSTRSIF